MEKILFLVSLVIISSSPALGKFQDEEVLYDDVFNEDELNGEPRMDEKAVIEYDQGFLDTTFYSK